MASLKDGFYDCLLHCPENIYDRVQAAMARKRLLRGSRCAFSEIVNECVDAMLPQLDEEAPIVPIKKSKPKLRPAGRLKQFA